MANTAVGLAELGGRAGFIGAVADDDVGHTYTQDLRDAGVVFEPHCNESAEGELLGTGRCIVLISPTTLEPATIERRRRADHGHLPGRGVDPDRCGGA